MLKRKQSLLIEDAVQGYDGIGTPERDIPIRQRQDPARLQSDRDDLNSLSGSESDVESDTEYRRSFGKRRRYLSHILAGDVDFPLSAYDGWEAPLPASLEAEATLALRFAYTEKPAPDATEPSYLSFILDAFSIYRPDSGNRAMSMVSLDQLQNGRGCDEFLFNGVLSCGSIRRYVQGVRFNILAIDGYGDPEIDDMSGHICIQSKWAKHIGVWYQLRTPASEYWHFHRPFMWLSTFTKHFIDFLLTEDRATLLDFKQRFFGWLYARLSSEQPFQSWLSQCNLRDFRTTIAAHVGFLWKECAGIDDYETGLCQHPLWAEVDPVKLTAIPRQPAIENHTVVTPFVFDCFRHMYFAEHLQERHVSDHHVRKAVKQRKKALGLTLQHYEVQDIGLRTPDSVRHSVSDLDSLHVSRGDVVCIPPDTMGTWKSSATTWYAYVQNVRHDAQTTLLDVLWLYDHSDTTLGNAYYPFSNELFLSDNCSCGKEAVRVTEVVGKVEVSFFVQDPTSVAGLFVRQKFRTIHDEDKYDFISLKRTDFTCGCKDQLPVFEDCRRQFQVGDNILFLGYSASTGQQRFEPAQIVDFLLERRQVVLRRLQRRSEAQTYTRAPPNELLLTTDIFTVPPSTIYRKCHIRYFHPEVVQEGLPVPYSQGGVGDYFFIVRDIPAPGNSPPGLVSEANTSFDDAKLPPLKQGWDPDARPPIPKLRGMGLFCGGGNFDRGIEDGGAVTFEYAIDYNEHALHSYRANVKEPEQLQAFLGSVNDYLVQAMAGSTKTVVAGVGDCQAIAAGSPCQGFSLANRNAAGASDDKGQRNASMVASVLSYIDFYSPQYCILENVVAITNGRGPKRDESVFRQILATLVAMGYQVQQFLMEAWLFGSAQRRSRVFIVASAPGTEPLPAPSYTHGDTEMWPERRLGASSNGKPFGVRRQEETVFTHVSAQEATGDLPDIGDSLPQLCPEFPDHRTPFSDSNRGRSLAAVTPVYPKGIGLVQAIRRGLEQQRLIENSQDVLKSEVALISPISGQPLDFYNTTLSKNVIRSGERSKVYARVHPDQLFPTMLTVVHPMDGINGPALHWNQPRSLTVMEARRAQGFLDHEVLIGSPAQQMRIVGNSVDRKVAITLGLALRESWLKSQSDRHRGKEGQRRNEAV